MNALHTLHKARSLQTLALLSALTVSSLSYAGRPLSVEDAGVNPAQQCQLEAWVAQDSDDQHSLALAPACGLGYGVELGVEFDTPRRSSRTETARSVALKWVPEEAQWMGWAFGGKVSLSTAKAGGSTNWESGASVLGIATHAFDEQWTVHLNLGADFTRNPSKTNATAGAALVWTPHKNWLIFGELSGAEGESATRSGGVRFWLMPDVLGLDLTASHVNATPQSTSYTLGLGWYGIKF